MTFTNPNSPGSQKQGKKETALTKMADHPYCLTNRYLQVSDKYKLRVMLRGLIMKHRTSSFQHTVQLSFFCSVLSVG